MKTKNIKQIWSEFDEAWALSGLDYPKELKEEYRYIKKFFRQTIKEVLEGIWDGHTSDDVLERLKKI